MCFWCKQLTSKRNFYLAVSCNGDDFEPDEAQRVDDDSGSAGGGVAVLKVTVVGIAGEVRELYL